MIESNDKSIVYVTCPAFHKTGGTELSHQLVHQINKMGGNAKIAYFCINNNPMQINKAFLKYVSDFVDIKNIIDSSNNVVIASESNPEILKIFHHAQKCIWWMSVDFYLKKHDFFQSAKIFGIRTDRRRLFTALRNTFSPKIIKDPAISHFYQSEYARNFLMNAGITNVYRLSDYLNEEYLHLDINTNRKDVVLYNPKKGLAFTQKLMKFAPDIQWVPLQNMTTEQVKETLLHSKVYIDFGNHPGKDRFPREAAMCGCCVITGKRGSAKFFDDVPIADEFKFDESRKTIPLIISKIRECLDNYETESPKFNGYREFIKGEYQTFQDDVKSIFHLTKDSKHQD